MTTRLSAITGLSDLQYDHMDPRTAQSTIRLVPRSSLSNDTTVVLPPIRLETRNFTSTIVTTDPEPSLSGGGVVLSVFFQIFEFDLRRVPPTSALGSVCLILAFPQPNLTEEKSTVSQISPISTADGPWNPSDHNEHQIQDNRWG